MPAPSQSESEPEGESCDEGQPGVLEEHAHAQTDIDPREADLIERAQTSRGPGSRPMRLEVPELEARPSPRLGGLHPLTHQALRVHLDVDVELFAHLLLDRGAVADTAPERPETRLEPTPEVGDAAGRS